jgi:restriction system protein
MAGPHFVKYFPYVLTALKELGNSGTPPEVRDLIVQKLELTDDELNQSISSGASRFDNQVAWAKFYLAKAGYIDSSKRGVWSLTDKGIAATITEKDALKIFQDVQKQFKGKAGQPQA